MAGANAENFRIMKATADQLVGMIQKRLANRLELLNTLSGNPMDVVPDEVKKMREIEASRGRAVMQEQKDIIEIIQMLYPDGQIG